MTTPWHAMSKEEKEATSTLFDVLDTVDALEGHGKSDVKSVGFADLYDYANEPNGIMSAELGRALISDASLRKDLDQLINRLSLYHFPKAAAASSGALDSREGDGYKIKLKVSRANDSQIYVIVDVSDPNELQPESLVVKLADGRYIKQALPVGVNSSYQMLLDTDSDMIMALRDIKTEVFLL